MRLSEMSGLRPQPACQEKKSRAAPLPGRPVFISIPSRQRYRPLLCQLTWREARALWTLGGTIAYDCEVRLIALGRIPINRKQRRPDRLVVDVHGELVQDQVAPNIILRAVIGASKGG